MKKFTIYQLHKNAQTTRVVNLLSRMGKVVISQDMSECITMLRDRNLSIDDAVTPRVWVEENFVNKYLGTIHTVEATAEIEQSSWNEID